MQDSSGASPTAYDAALAHSGASRFTRGGARPMTIWVVVGGDRIAEDPLLHDWIRAALRSLETADRPGP